MTEHKMLDRVWMIAHPTKGLFYSPPGTSPQEAWEKAEQWESLNASLPPSHFREEMRLNGWRAKKVFIALAVWE